jgi:hypothetical protein
MVLFLCSEEMVTGRKNVKKMTWKEERARKMAMWWGEGGGGRV